MIQFLLSALLVVVLAIVFVIVFKSVLKKNPTSVKAVFGKWFSIEANFKAETSETRN